MSPLHRTTYRALVGLTAVALAAGTLGTSVATAATPAPVSHSATIYGTASPTFDGTYRQSLAILGLHAAGLTPPASAVQWLVNQQCADGGFVELNLTPGSACTPSDEDSNGTALAAQALQATGRTTESAAAVAHLKATQQSDGGWEYGTGYGSDANSTGLALMALAAAGVTPTYSNSGTFFAAQQIGQGVTALDPADKGAFSPSWAGGQANLFATDQAVPGIGGANLVNVPSPSSWAAVATAYPTAPVVTPANVAGWASTWLAAQVNGDAVTGGDLAWCVLSFATTATAKTAALAAYAALRTTALDIGTNPGALAQAALAAKALGKPDDATMFGNLIAQTLTATPTATYSVSASALWSSQRLKLTRLSLGGGAGAITQTIAWGDGSTTTGPAASATSWSHLYTTTSAVTRTIRVRLTDAHADTRLLSVRTIRVTKDNVKPTVALSTPSNTAAASAWQTLTGTTGDVGLGVKNVSVALVEQRNGSWYSYNGATWAKKSSYAAARGAAKHITVTARSTGRWSLHVARLTTGTIQVSYLAADLAGNRSAAASVTGTLTR